ncbi:rod shape-determining protein MreC [Terribacillus saccharophilus]|uniref:rod shape-determining protein MreC n=1 Tax=Terribacillus saccharophilus TaxID=361277 RepID=UPI000BA6F19F|nr:rod shape-determining protein MreC [Terribacillus saccharophilus]PAF21812.1 rod shape-determining protein MreC [Terribacillus saccharophilus]
MNFFKKKRMFLFLIAIIILVGLIGFSTRDRSSQTLPEQIISDTVGFVQNIFSKPAQFTSTVMTNIKDLKNTYEENQVLKSKVDDYKGLQFRYQELEKQYDDLKATNDSFNKYTSMDYDPIPADVIVRSPEGWFDQLTIDKGSDDGVETNMAVMTASGMIGKIEDVSRSTSSVQLLSGFNESNRISAQISGGENEDGEKQDDIFGLIEGYDEKDGMLLFTGVKPELEVKKGSTVVSSGLGGVFPKGLPIGEVDSVELDQYGLSQTIHVKPTADLYDIEQVMVVDAASEEASSSNGDEGL